MTLNMLVHLNKCKNVPLSAMNNTTTAFHRNVRRLPVMTLARCALALDFELSRVCGPAVIMNMTFSAMSVITALDVRDTASDTLLTRGLSVRLSVCF